jgi:CheY-like chemotaxis protein
MHKLLLADDSVTIQRVIELTFSGEDVQVVAVNDGEQAITRIPLERPDIVLADIAMPKRSGYDVAAFVKGRADLEHIPVVLLAGAFEPVDQSRAEQVKCDGVLIKPFEPRQVISRVRELIEGAAARAALAAEAATTVERSGSRDGSRSGNAEDQDPIDITPVATAAVEPQASPAPAAAVAEPPSPAPAEPPVPATVIAVVAAVVEHVVPAPAAPAAEMMAAEAPAAQVASPAPPAGATPSAAGTVPVPTPMPMPAPVPVAEPAQAPATVAAPVPPSLPVAAPVVPVLPPELQTPRPSPVAAAPVPPVVPVSRVPPAPVGDPLAMPAPRQNAQRPAGSIDEYLDRLNVAFSSLGRQDAPVSSPAGPPFGVEVPVGTAPPEPAVPSAADEAFPPVDSLDDYFERLNAAFASGPSPAPAPVAGASAEPAETLFGVEDDGLDRPPVERLPTIAELVGDDSLAPRPYGALGELGDTGGLPEATSLPRFDVTAANRDVFEEFAHPSSLAEAFGALLSDDADDAFGDTLSQGGEPVDDALVEHVTRRVLDRLAPEVAVRLRELVREELAKVGGRR